MDTVPVVNGEIIMEGNKITNNDTSKNYKFNKREYDLKLEYIEQRMNDLKEHMTNNADNIKQTLDNIMEHCKNRCDQIQMYFRELNNKVDYKTFNPVKDTVSAHKAYWKVFVGAIFVLLSVLKVVDWMIK